MVTQSINNIFCFVISSVCFVRRESGPPILTGISSTGRNIMKAGCGFTSVVQNISAGFNMKTNPGIMMVSLLSMVAGELAPRYLPIVPNALAGQGYNPGTSGQYQEHGQGYNPGYNPGQKLVAFTASQADFCCLRRGKLMLQRTLTNLGGGWNGRSGEFRAPASGTYVFSWSALSSSNNHLQLALMRNGLEMVSSWADSQGYQSASGTAVLTLRRGDLLYLSVLGGEVHEPRNSDRGYTTFSGYRIG